MNIIPEADLPPLSFRHVALGYPRNTFDVALAIATAAHRGQTDKRGEPYIMHPIRVAQAVWAQGEAHRIVAILHDVVEDSPWTVTLLAFEGFAPEVLSAVDALTKRRNEPYAGYLVRVAAEPIARAVKIADLHDNLDPARMVGDEGEQSRRGRYQDALAWLTEEA